MSKRGSLSTRTMVDFKSTPLEPLAFNTKGSSVHLLRRGDAALAEKDAPMQARGEKPPSRIIDFDALSDPEGSLLLIDATTVPYVHKYQSVKKFLESPYQERRAKWSDVSFGVHHTPSASDIHGFSRFWLTYAKSLPSPVVR
jgi:hypothetical protein